MNINAKPDIVTKLARMSDATIYEPAGDSPQAERHQTPKLAGRKLSDIKQCISHVSTPTGKMPVLKSMITSACERDCFYCPFRAGRDKMRRESFTPDEMASVFDKVQRAKLVEGLFLSSGIINGGVTVQDKVIDTVEILRKKYNYRGYVHLKIMPGAEMEQIRRAMQLADRISINLEGPTKERLQALAPKKDFDGELLNRLLWAGKLRREMQQYSGQKLAGLVTQFVVGAVGDTDLELLALSQRLYHDVDLKRVYYSGFNPVEDTPFEHLQATTALREFRLYQSSFLLRDYGWDVEELPFQQDGNLPTDIDPKRAWADLHLLHSPLDIMLAERKELLHVPGIGPLYADAIIKARSKGNLSDLSHLHSIGIRATSRIAPYILLDGHRPPQQLPLWPG